MKAFTVREALAACKGKFFGDESALDRIVTSVSSDSRTAKEGTLFVAFKGARADGHSFMAGCLENGAACCLSEREPAGAQEMPCIVVESTLTAVGAIAAWQRARHDFPVVGITGSVGKTTTKEMISAVLSRRFKTHKTEKNFNNELGVPQTIFAMPEDSQAAVIEMGISDFGEMTRLTNIVRPNIAVISIIGDAHLEFLGDRDGVLRAKSEIFASMGEGDTAILNGDDPYLRKLQPSIRTISYGKGEDNDFVATDIENLAGEGMRMRIRHHGASFPVHIPAFGAHMVYAALAGCACGWAMGMSDEEIAAGIADYQTVGNRAKLIDTGKITIISDCYNANPNSTASSIDSLVTLKGRKVCILGDMLELGRDTLALHAGIGKKAAESGVDLLIACGELSRATYEGAKEAGGNALHFAEKQAVIEALGELIQPGDCVLVKASHSMAFEDFVEVLEKL